MKLTIPLFSFQRQPLLPKAQFHEQLADRRECSQQELEISCPEKKLPKCRPIGIPDSKPDEPHETQKNNKKRENEKKREEASKRGEIGTRRNQKRERHKSNTSIPCGWTAMINLDGVGTFPSSSQRRTTSYSKYSKKQIDKKWRTVKSKDQRNEIHLESDDNEVHEKKDTILDLTRTNRSKEEARVYRVKRKR